MFNLFTHRVFWPVFNCTHTAVCKHASVHDVLYGISIPPAWLR